MPPISDTQPRTWTPNGATRHLATPPTATRAAVSRALARSRMLRTSRWLYLRAPARSACPGRGRVTARLGSRSSARGDIFFFQFRAAHEDVADVALVVLEGARQVGVPGPRAGHRQARIAVLGPRGHLLLPVPSCARGCCGRRARCT